MLARVLDKLPSRYDKGWFGLVVVLMVVARVLERLSSRLVCLGSYDKVWFGWDW